MSWDSKVIPAIETAAAQRDPRLWWLPSPLVANILAYRVAVESAGNPTAVGAAGEAGLFQFLNDRSYRPGAAPASWRTDPGLSALAATSFLGQAASGPAGAVYGVPFAAQVAAHTAWTRGTFRASLAPTFASSSDEARVMGLVEEYGWRMVYWWLANAAAAYLLGRYLASVRWTKLAFIAYVVAVGSLIPPLLGLLYARGWIWQGAEVSPTSSAGSDRNPTWETMTAGTDASDSIPGQGDVEVTDAGPDPLDQYPQSDTSGDPNAYGQYPQSDTSGDPNAYGRYPESIP